MGLRQASLTSLTATSFMASGIRESFESRVEGLRSIEALRARVACVPWRWGELFGLLCSCLQLRGS